MSSLSNHFDPLFDPSPAPSRSVEDAKALLEGFERAVSDVASFVEPLDVLKDPEWDYLHSREFLADCMQASVIMKQLSSDRLANSYSFELFVPWGVVVLGREGRGPREDALSVLVSYPCSYERSPVLADGTFTMHSTTYSDTSQVKPLGTSQGAASLDQFLQDVPARINAYFQKRKEKAVHLPGLIVEFGKRFLDSPSDNDLDPKEPSTQDRPARAEPVWSGTSSTNHRDSTWACARATVILAHHEYTQNTRVALSQQRLEYLLDLYGLTLFLRGLPSPPSSPEEYERSNHCLQHLIHRWRLVLERQPGDSAPRDRLCLSLAQWGETQLEAQRTGYLEFLKTRQHPTSDLPEPISVCVGSLKEIGHLSEEGYHIHRREVRFDSLDRTLHEQYKHACTTEDKLLIAEDYMFHLAHLINEHGASCAEFAGIFGDFTDQRTLRKVVCHYQSNAGERLQRGWVPVQQTQRHLHLFLWIELAVALLLAQSSVYDSDPELFQELSRFYAHDFNEQDLWDYASSLHPRAARAVRHTHCFFRSMRDKPNKQPIFSVERSFEHWRSFIKAYGKFTAVRNCLSTWRREREELRQRARSDAKNIESQVCQREEALRQAKRDYDRCSYREGSYYQSLVRTAQNRLDSLDRRVELRRSRWPLQELHRSAAAMFSTLHLRSPFASLVDCMGRLCRWQEENSVKKFTSLEDSRSDLSCLWTWKSSPSVPIRVAYEDVLYAASDIIDPLGAQYSLSTGEVRYPLGKSFRENKVNIAEGEILARQLIPTPTRGNFSFSEKGFDRAPEFFTEAAWEDCAAIRCGVHSELIHACTRVCSSLLPVDKLGSEALSDDLAILSDVMGRVAARNSVTDREVDATRQAIATMFEKAGSREAAAIGLFGILVGVMPGTRHILPRLRLTLGADALRVAVSCFAELVQVTQGTDSYYDLRSQQLVACYSALVCFDLDYEHETEYQLDLTPDEMKTYLGAVILRQSVEKSIPENKRLTCQAAACRSEALPCASHPAYTTFCASICEWRCGCPVGDHGGGAFF